MGAFGWFPPAWLWAFGSVLHCTILSVFTFLYSRFSCSTNSTTRKKSRLQACSSSWELWKSTIIFSDHMAWNVRKPKLLLQACFSIEYNGYALSIQNLHFQAKMWGFLDYQWIVDETSLLLENSYSQYQNLCRVCQTAVVKIAV